MGHESTTDEINQITRRLEELEHLRASPELSDVQAEELAAEEHRLEIRLRELTDTETQELEGVAEQLVKSEGGNADEVPKLPGEEAG
jgi:hypothetical protein